ncbi:substrate of the Dot/Icm secretion system, LepB-like [Legionella busanensis]|uniref:Substrate of the Dot/Icm secretion system, LepB-like n=1 Tax=Legionella busanensis TaxID=190655 RepID=A0A378JR36_9GAMM|nr:hypothetical protein [Legionella busanensis]STX50582.1 substrate of the Dot/Icm secretion system, LepB-like [Legionella busanensis]
MLRYKDKELVKIAATIGGKNQLKGFYKDKEGNVYFVKKPTDLKELFTELLAGLLLKEFKQENLIEPQYFNSLIDADWIKFEDGSYGLIQPKVEFTELYKIIGTGYKDNSDRNPLIEMLNGSNHYALLTSQFRSYYGLSIALMFSLLFGDYSVHSGNIVCLNRLATDNEKKTMQFARIDWGAAFRYFNYYEDILNPFEYQGWSKYKLITKGYIFNYKKINGLFTAIAQRAFALRLQINIDWLYNLVLKALKEIPPDLLTFPMQKSLSEYLGFSSFSTVIFSERQNYEPFAKDFSDILFKRLNNICKLKNLTKDRSFLYRSISFDNLTNIVDNSTLENQDEKDVLPENLDLDNQIIINEKYIQILFKKFSDELLTDSVFIDIISQGKIINFKPEIIKDLLILKKFYTENLALNENRNYGQIYSEFLTTFYKESLIIRLSEQDRLDQAKNLLGLAYKYLYLKDVNLYFFSEVIQMLDSLFDSEILVSKLNIIFRDENRFFNYKNLSVNLEAPEVKRLELTNEL